jgi:hypothetical protein
MCNRGCCMGKKSEIVIFLLAWSWLVCFDHGLNTFTSDLLFSGGMDVVR